MKLKQVNEKDKCPTCKRNTLISCPYHIEQTGYYSALLYDYYCKNCDAKFIDEDKDDKQKN